MSKFRYVLAALLIVAGIVICSLGRILLSYTTFCSSILATIFGINTLLHLIGHDNISTLVYWIALLISIILGLILAQIQTKFVKVGGYVLAGLTGTVIGQAVSNLIYFSMRSTIIYWIIIGTGAPIVISLTTINYNHQLIWVTAIFGAYLFLISLCEFITRWPLELNLPYLAEVGAITKVENNYWVFMGFWLGLSIIGTAFQFILLLRMKRSRKEFHPVIKEAIESFNYGRTAHQLDIAKSQKSLEEYFQCHASSSS